MPEEIKSDEKEVSPLDKKDIEATETGELSPSEQDKVAGGSARL